MKIGDIIKAFRARRAHRIQRSDSVAFEAFCNEALSDRYPQTKESCLSEDVMVTPVKVPHKVIGYEHFTGIDDIQSSRPSLSTILLIIILSAVFFILPLIYLIHCFDIIYDHNTIRHNPIVENADQFEPDIDVHDLLDKSAEVPLKLSQCRLLKDKDKFNCFPENGANQDSCESRGCCWIPGKPPKNTDNVEEVPLNVPYCFYPPDYDAYKYLNFNQTAFGLDNNMKQNSIGKNADHFEPDIDLHDLLDKSREVSVKLTGILPFPPKPNYSQCRLLKDEDKFDCFPENGANKDSCESRGCCWIPGKFKPPKNHDNLEEAPLNVPYCFYPPDYDTYKYVNFTQTAFGLVAFLKRSYRTAYPDDVDTLKMIVKYESENRLHVKFVDPGHSRFEPPFPEVPIVDNSAINLNYIFEMDPFRTGFKVVRKSDNTTMFDASDFLNFIYSNQFLQISARLPSNYIYGIGEHQNNLLLSTKWTKYTLFNHDSIPSFNRNLYGSHPFYLVMENSTKAHGVFLLNSNAMDVILQPTPAITFRTIGGMLDFYFFVGPTPSDVISQYTDLIGRPYMPPYWGLGFHLCRFGYKTLNNTKVVMERNIEAGIPLDTQWNDLDYMNNSNMFTYDKANFKGLPQFVKDLHSRNMHYIPLIDPGISASEKPGTYPPFDIGIKMDILVKNFSGQPFIGKVWNKGQTAWPDFTHPSTVDYWTHMLGSLHKDVPFDGTWIDMNEPSNFYSGAYNGCPKSSLESPPYVPGVDGNVLNYKTLCMSAKHYAGLHYNVHNLYGLSEAIVTNFAMAEIRGKRPIVISRSTFPGHGHYAGHWSGDVWSAWTDMRYSIPQLLSFSLFGIPLMGADICGFNGNTTEALCNRWQQLGAFYPFSRNHNTDDGIDQDPVAMGSLVVASTKKALTVRYSLLPYLYTLFFKAHTQGDTVARPLFFEFVNDVKTYSVDTQFLWGSALMIVPVLEDNCTEVTAYVPEGIWYDFYTLNATLSKGETFNISAPLDTIPVLVRGGSILPQQGVKQNTIDSRKTKIQLLVAPDVNGEAFGELYWDDGDSLNSFEEKRYSLIEFGLQNAVLRSENSFWGTETPPNLGTVTVLGVNKPVTEVVVNNVSQAFKFDTVHKYLLVDNLNLAFKKPIVISWK